MDNYYELLKHPLWQRKRLEIFSRDNWTCVKCGATEKTLHVHHGFKEKGRAPWDYPNETLSTLCEDCHTQIHETPKAKAVKDSFIFSPTAGKIKPDFYRVRLIDKDHVEPTVKNAVRLTFEIVIGEYLGRRVVADYWESYAYQAALFFGVLIKDSEGRYARNPDLPTWAGVFGSEAIVKINYRKNKITGNMNEHPNVMLLGGLDDNWSPALKQRLGIKL